jgi:hypothetical protein
MSLGNANTSAQSGGKNKPIVVKRRKEVVAAVGYTQISASPKQSSNACSVNTSSGLTETYYHDGSAALPAQFDQVYSKRQASDRFYLQPGHYKTSTGTLHQSFEIARAGTVIAVTGCKS